MEVIFSSTLNLEASQTKLKNSVLSGQVLVLNQSYEPISICSPQKAMILIFLMKADLVASKEDLRIRTVAQEFPFPSVIKLRRYIRFPYRKVELSRKNIMRRDGHECQYCGSKNHLTIDHVMPRSRGGKDTWENLVTACVVCNNKKSNKTPEEAGMPLLNKPFKPHHIIYLKQFVTNLEETWKPYLFI